MTSPTFSRLVPVICKSALSEARPGRSIMVRYFKGKLESKQTVIFVPGFMSHGQGLKAKFLADHCSVRGFNYLCYDPEGLFNIEKN